MNVGFNIDDKCDVTFNILQMEIVVNELTIGGTVIPATFPFLNKLLQLKASPFDPSDPDNLRRSFTITELTSLPSNFVRFTLKRSGSTDLFMKIIREKHTDWSWILAVGTQSFIGEEDTKVQRGRTVGTGIFNLEGKSSDSVIINATGSGSDQEIVVFYSIS